MPKRVVALRKEAITFRGKPSPLIKVILGYNKLFFFSFFSLLFVILAESTCVARGPFKLYKLFIILLQLLFVII